MNKILLTLSFLIAFQAVIAQNRCNRPLSSMEFNQRRQQVNAVNNEARKLQAAIRVSQENCLTASQVKDLAMLLNDEFNRLDYAQRAYNTVFDPENYYEVYDVFNKFSMAIRLYDFVNGRNSNPVVVNPMPTTPSPISPNPVSPSNPNNNYPNYQYPDASNYAGTRNCSAPISGQMFEMTAQKIRATSAMGVKANLARQAVQNNCLSVSQLMRLVSLVPEASRLELLRGAYQNIFDVNNLPLASQVFEIRSNQDQWASFLSQNGVGTNNSSNPIIGGICEVAANEYNNILATLRRESIQSNRFNLMKNVTSGYQCFSVEQVRGIVKLYNIDSFRLDAAKYLFDYTNPNERRQYFMVANEFSFSSSRADLSNFIAEKNR